VAVREVMKPVTASEAKQSSRRENNDWITSSSTFLAIIERAIHHV